MGLVVPQPTPDPEDVLPASDLAFLEATDATLTDSPVVGGMLKVERARRISKVYERLQRVPTSEDVVQKIDVRTWPKAPLPDQIIECGADQVPESRLRRVMYSDGRMVYECWTPIPRAIESDDLSEIARQANHGVPIQAWRLSYHLWGGYCECPSARLRMSPAGLLHEECGRPRASRIEGDLREHILSQHLAPEDDATHNGYYATIRGNDVAHVGSHVIRDRAGNPLRGGTEITGGRAQRRSKMKNRYVEFDKGFFEHTDRIRSEQQAKRDADFALRQEKADKMLPRKLGEL